MNDNQTIYLEPGKPRSGQSVVLLDDARESSYAIISALQEARAAIDRALTLVG